MGRAPPATTQGKVVQLRTDQGSVKVELTLLDFAALKQINLGSVEIKHREKEYRRLVAMRLVTHRFEYPPDGGFPMAMAELTPLGKQALAQEFT